MTERSVVILKTQMRNQVFAAQVTKGVLELHQLDENIVLGIERRRGHWRLEVEGEPFLDAFHAGALGQIEEESQVEHNWGGQDRVTAEKIDLDLHLIAEPAEDVDVVPAFLVVAPWRIVIDSDNMGKVFVKLWVDVRLQDVFEH